MAANSTDAQRKRLDRIAANFPGIETGTSYGTPCWRVRKALLARLWQDGETLVSKCADMAEKEFLLSADPAIFYDTDHYRGYPAILVRLRSIEDDPLTDLIARAWRRKAGRRHLAAFDGEG